VSKKLVGELALLRYLQDNRQHYALGQITEVALRNIWHEDPTMRSLIRQRGRVDPVSERQDTHQGAMTVSAVFANDASGYRPSILGTVPATGTAIHMVDDDVLNELLLPYKRQLFYLGHVYGSTPRLPMWFKHFDMGPEGAGEAYHLGIFGKTGSGKSVLAKMVLTAYARYPKMALLVIDPQGEFAKDVRGGSSGQFTLPMKQILDRLGKEKVVFGVRDLILDRWELFAQILYESPFFAQLSIPKSENRMLAAQALEDRLQRADISLKNLHERGTFNQAWGFLGEDRTQKLFYRTESSRQRFQSMYEHADRYRFYSYWRQVAELFRERPKARRIEQILNYLFDLERDRRALVVIDLSSDQMAQAARASLSDLPLFGNDSRSDEADSAVLWNDTIQALVIQRLLDGIRFAAERSFRQNRSLNTLVLIDEAHRLAPREDPENDE
jgi:DNA helicase HerA-like ATPase